MKTGYWVCQDLWELPDGIARAEEVPGAKQAESSNRAKVNGASAVGITLEGVTKICFIKILLKINIKNEKEGRREWMEWRSKKKKIQRKK